jgi:hypothetical protein
MKLHILVLSVIVIITQAIQYGAEANETQKVDKQIQQQAEKYVITLAELFMAHYRLLKKNDLTEEQSSYLHSRLREIQAEIVKIISENDKLAKLELIANYEDEEIKSDTAKPKKPFKWGR